MQDRILYKIHVKGRVQGVGFRWSALSEARHRGVTGFVKNMPDGSVYIEAEGPREILDSFMEWCRTGPGTGYVESVNVESSPPANYPDFEIRR